MEDSGSAEKEKRRPTRTGSRTNFGDYRIDGSKSKHILVRENGLVKVENGMPFYKVAALPCGNITGVGRAIPPTPVATVLEDISD